MKHLKFLGYLLAYASLIFMTALAISAIVVPFLYMVMVTP